MENEVKDLGAVSALVVLLGMVVFGVLDTNVFNGQLSEFTRVNSEAVGAFVALLSLLLKTAINERQRGEVSTRGVQVPWWRRML